MDADRSDDEASVAAQSRKSEHEGPKDFPWSIEIALSGGGHRAAAYALGALLYLVHANLNSRVRNISSVSGASITNAFVASQCDFQAVKIDEFKVIASKLILKIARSGLLSVWTTWACVAVVIIVAIATSVAFGMIWWTFVGDSLSLDLWGAFVIFLMVVSLALTSRGWIIDRWMAAVYFPPRQSEMRPWDTVIRLEDIDRASLRFWQITENSTESSTVASHHLGVGGILIEIAVKLRNLSFAQAWQQLGALVYPTTYRLSASGGGFIAKERKSKLAKINFEQLRDDKNLAKSARIMEMNDGVDHVFCTTDLSSGRPFFFSSAFGGRQVSTFYGRGEAPFVPLQVAVRASSAFPPAIPAIPYRPQSYHGGPVQFLRKNRQHLYSRIGPNDQDGFGKGIEEIAGVPTIWLTDGGAYNNFGTDWHVARRVAWQLDLKWTTEFHPLSDIGNKQISRVLGLSYYGQIQLIVDASQPARRGRLADLYIPIWELLRYAFRTMNVMYGSTLEARSGEGYFVAFDRVERYPAKWALGTPAKQPASYQESHANAQEVQREFWDQGALQIYMPYQMRLDLIYSWWKDRTRSSTDSQSRWEDHPRKRNAALAALEELVPNELEFVKTTFRSLGCHQTLRLVVAGYLNTREGIYGPFDFRLEEIPKKRWFGDLLTLAAARRVTRSC